MTEDSIRSSAPHPLIFSQLFAFADRYNTKQLRDDTMTLMVEIDLERRRQGLNKRLLSYKWWGWMHDNLPSNSAIYRYTIRNIALTRWQLILSAAVVHLIPNKVMYEIASEMSCALPSLKEAKDYLTDCCNFHEHSAEESVTCPATYYHDRAFFSAFLKVCLKGAGFFQERQLQETSQEVAATDEELSEQESDDQAQLEEGWD